MITKAEMMKRFIEIGISVEHAILAADEIEKAIGGSKISDAHKARNKRYYDARAEELRAKARERKESLRRLKNPVSDGFKTVKTTETGKYLAKIGTPQYDAWNTYNRDRFGKGLPLSDKHNGWFVDAEWPPSHVRAAAHRAGVS